MALLTLKNIALGFGHPPLFEDVSFSLDPGERLCIIGRNGTGKSTLLKIMAGQLPADGGEIIKDEHLSIGFLPQQVPQSTTGTVEDVVLRGLGQQEAAYRAALSSGREQQASGDNVADALAAEEGWQYHPAVERAFTMLDVDRAQDFATLSGGQKRQVLLARALASDPDVLLLDEPTNHLDIAKVEWLEQFLTRLGTTLVFVTHDRAFLKTLATGIIEIDHGKAVSFDCTYNAYLKRKEAMEAARATEQTHFDKKLAQEEIWIRQGIKARRTRNEGRVRRLTEMRQMQAQRRAEIGQMDMTLQNQERTSKLIARAKDVRYSWDGTPCIRRFSATIVHGDRIAIMGPNGCGKTTLLKILLGQLEPQEGFVRTGKGLDVAYFDQHRQEVLDEDTVMAAVADGGDFVTIDGKPRHVIGYLKNFLFDPERARGPVSVLSGGERNRLLLAKLFTKSFQVLVMDEPTNDLDTETLELLEDKLMAFTGTLLFVSHDREFVNSVATSTLVFEDAGRITQYAGGYDDWLIQRKAANNAHGELRPKPTSKTKVPDSQHKSKAKKLGFNEKRELQQLPTTIDALEKELDAIRTTFADPDFYLKDPAEQQSLETRMHDVEALVSNAYDRWQALENLRE